MFTSTNPHDVFLRAAQQFYLTEALTDDQLAAQVDAAMDAAYQYGRSTPGKSFGWQAALSSVAHGREAIARGETDLDAVADAVHQGWNATAERFVQNPDQFSDTAALRQSGKLEAKLAARKALMSKTYAQLPEHEKEKDRVVARVLLTALAPSADRAEVFGRMLGY